MCTCHWSKSLPSVVHINKVFWYLCIIIVDIDFFLRFLDWILSKLNASKSPKSCASKGLTWLYLLLFTTLENGSFLMSRLVDFWYCLISINALTPGLNLFFFRKLPSKIVDIIYLCQQVHISCYSRHIIMIPSQTTIWSYSLSMLKLLA